LAKVLKAGAKVDLIDCSSGAMSPQQRIRIHPGLYGTPRTQEVPGWRDDPGYLPDMDRPT